ncbi:carbohydrate-binding protein [Couchioplanes azureus]|uniref:carbohydrate-binding protein n=1 Tax=Couchioplanes caeruleus TaxID=56438 RepID=UPI00167166E7|nr:carbohydrate-binding protein [Couchioplanes caeruleus]GGQ56090.1 hypothetical protein GCM10010166_26900 [Couchioplanes caeruleus subsp. azureus]
MTTPTSPSAGVYHSRSRVTRNRVALTAAGLALVAFGYLLGRLQGGDADPASAAAAPPAPVPAVSSAAATPAPSAPPSAATPDPSAPPSVPASAPAGGIDAYTVIQAEDATSQQGTEPEDTEDEGGGRNVGWINNGDWLRFDGVDFGTTPATRFAARVASDVGDGVTGQVEIRLDSPAGPPVGNLTVGNMGGWQNWQTQSTVITPVTGTHAVYLTFVCQTGAEFLNLNYFAFGR